MYVFTRGDKEISAKNSTLYLDDEQEGASLVTSELFYFGATMQNWSAGRPFVQIRCTCGAAFKTLALDDLFFPT